MNNSSSHHEPSPEFRAQLKHEIARAVRSDQLFGAAPAHARTRRVVMALGIAGGVALTLFTGMILGASASYASAAEPDAPRPTLAIRPISNALSAIGCGVMKAEPHVPKATQAPPPVQQPAVAAAVDSTPIQVAQANPDRAKIAALASQHQGNVIRGDTAAEYIVMVLDAANKYVWSTFGSGNVSIEVAGDTRAPVERMAYYSAHAAEYGDVFTGAVAYHFTRDSLSSTYLRAFRSKPLVLTDSLKGTLYAGAVKRYFTRLDSLSGYARGYVFLRGDTVRGEVTVDLGRGGAGGRGGFFADTGSTYNAGWSAKRNGSPRNQALGLDAGPGNGYSGITGLPSSWIAMAETYFFAPGQLAPKDLKVLVVHLTPGTIWTGR